MDFPRIHTSTGFTLPKQGEMADTSRPEAVSGRKQPQKSAGNSGLALRLTQHDKSLLANNAVPELPSSPPIKQRIISTAPDSPTAGSSRVSHPGPAASFVLSAEQMHNATSDTGLIAAIASFPPTMQERLQRFRHNGHIKAVLTSASVFLATLRVRGIELSLLPEAPHTPILFARLGNYSLETEPWLLGSFFRKATVFFTTVDPEKISDTSCLSSMLHHRRHIQAFINMRDEAIQHVAINPCLTRLAARYNGKGLPDINLPAPLAAAPDMKVVLSRFCLSHQNHLRNNQNDDRTKALLNDGATLIDALQQRGIRLTLNHRRNKTSALLFNALTSLDVVKDHRIISSFLHKATVFFNAVDNARIRNTECLCTMLKHRLHIEMFTLMDDADIETVASHPLLLDLARHQLGKGLPAPEQIHDMTRPGDIKRLKETHSTQASGAFAAVIGQFVQEHQPALQQYLHIGSIQTLLNNAAKVLDILATRGIRLALNRRNPPTPSLFSTLKQCRVIDDYQLMSDYFYKAGVFFSVVDNAEIRDSYCLSNMMTYKYQIQTLTDTSDDYIRKVAGSPCLRQLCNVYRGKGLPDLNHINDFAGLEGLRDHRRELSFITTMCYARGMPSANEVLNFIHLFQDDDRALIPTVASMCKGRGIPDASLVTDFLTLGQVEQKKMLFNTLAVVCHALGIPSAAGVRNFLQWLPEGQTTIYLNLLGQFFSNAGVPELCMLRKHQKTLEKIFHQDLLPQPESKDTLAPEDRFKPFALFCVHPDKWRLSAEEFKDFLHATYFSSRHSALATMQAIVLNLGGAGVRLWLAKFNDNTPDMDTVTDALLVPAPLDIISFALSQLAAPHWLNYIELCKNLSPVPDRQQWESLATSMAKINARFPLNTNQKRMLLEILWSQDDRQVYVTHVDRLFLTVPTVRQLHHVYRQGNKQTMKAFLDACLVWRPTKSNPPGLPVIQALMDGLLLAYYPIDCPGEVPDHCFSRVGMQGPETGLIIDGAAVMTGNERLWHFVVAMLMELNRVGYRCTSDKTLSFIACQDNTPHLPRPRFTLTQTGFVITNWSVNHLKAFFLATDFEHHNAHPNICKKLALAHIKKAARMEQPKTTSGEPAAGKSATVFAEQGNGAGALEDTMPEDVDCLIEPPDLSWLQKESDFSEDFAQSKIESMSVEQMLALMAESEPDSPL